MWIFHAVAAARGARKMPKLSEFELAPGAPAPKISILFAARDEAEKLPAALSSMLAIDYPHLEVIAVDDRSADATGRILDEFAASNPRLQVIHVTQLGAGWLGKPHALSLAAARATGEWLVLTDADVRFQPESLQRAIAMTMAQRVDHLSLLAQADMIGFWEKVVMTSFALGFLMGVQPWLAADPHSKRYVGIGAFQMIRREVYGAIGGHEKLAMEVIEDMKLGKLVKQGGYRSVVGRVNDEICVRWQAGLGNLVRGTTKNFFAATGFRLWIVSFQVLGLLLMSVAPWIAIFFTHGWALTFAAISVGFALLMHAVVTQETHASIFYAFTHPIGASIFTWMLVRSTIVTLWRGGIVWRDTFYPLAELRRGIV